MPRQLLSAGPWKGVRDTRDPYDDAADTAFLQDAQNCYLPDPTGAGGIYARPGFRVAGPSSVGNLGGGQQAIAIFTMRKLDGTVLRFAAVNGKLYRYTAVAGDPLSVAVDVTPVGVTIDNSSTPTNRFYFSQLGDNLIFTDGVNRPWVGTNLSATPITGAYIDIDGAGGSWTARGAPVVYQGSLFFIAKTVPGGSSVTAGLGLVWSEPNQPTIGYTQTGYANFWNLIQQSSKPIYALLPMNNTLYYFRDTSIGSVSGTPGSNFSSTATSDTVSVNVGCTAPASIVQFGDRVFFVDRLGRPYMFVPGSEPQPIWKQLRGQIDDNPTYLTYPNNTAYSAVGAVVSQLNVVLLGGWSGDPTAIAPNAPFGPSTLYAFDAFTGAYFGRWSLNTTLCATGIAAMTEMLDTNNTPLLTVMTRANGAIAYKGLTLQPLGLSRWTDGEAVVTLYVPTITAKTQRLGFSSGAVWNATETGTALVQSTAPCTITVQTPYTSSTTEATALTPSSSSDTTYRVVFGMDVVSARGIQVTVSPTTATSQWIYQSVSFPAVPSVAGVEDQ